MTRMKFRDIPPGQWFYDDSGRRMVKMQQTNGMSDFHYLSGVIKKESSDDTVSLTRVAAAQVSTNPHDPMKLRLHQNTQCISFERNGITFQGFNAVDEFGTICRCPMDVEFNIEEADQKDALIHMLRERVGRLQGDLVDQGCVIEDAKRTCHVAKQLADNYPGPVDDYEYQRRQGESSLADQILEDLGEE